MLLGPPPGTGSDATGSDTTGSELLLTISLHMGHLSDTGEQGTTLQPCKELRVVR